jgi:hypothetical protein
MAASPMPAIAPPRLQSLGFLRDASDWSDDWVNATRNAINAANEHARASYEDAKKQTEEYISTIRSMLSRQPELDIDKWLDIAEETEDRFIGDRDSLTKEISSFINKIAGTHPEAIALLNGFKTEVVRAHNQMAALFRDTRWELMAARAAVQIGPGSGAIHGSGEPPAEND